MSPRYDVYVRISDNNVKRTHVHAGGMLNVDVDDSGVPVGVEVVGALQVLVNGHPVSPAPAHPEGELVDKVSATLRGYRLQLGTNSLSLIKSGTWTSVPLSGGEMRDITWLLQEAGLLREPPATAAEHADADSA